MPIVGLPTAIISKGSYLCTDRLPELKETIFNYTSVYRGLRKDTSLCIVNVRAGFGQDVQIQYNTIQYNTIQ